MHLEGVGAPEFAANRLQRRRRLTALDLGPAGLATSAVALIIHGDAWSRVVHADSRSSTACLSD